MATSPSQPSRPHWPTWMALGICALAVWVVFGGARHFGFVLWDDDHNIQQNSHLSGLTWENLRWMFTDNAYARRYIPLTWLGWNLDHDLFGLTAHSAHLGNIVFHLLNTFLVFFVIKAALRLWLNRETADRPWTPTVAATLGALLWAVHPLRVEVVAWASGRIYAQAACFLLFSAWSYLHSLELPAGSSPARRFRWAAALALALSLLTYPLALSFVGVLLVLDWYVPRRMASAAGATPASFATALREKIPFLVVTAAILGVTLWARTNVQAVGWKAVVTLEEFGVVSRFMQACYVWAYYVWKPLLPLDLSPFYPRLLLFQPGDWEFVLSLVVVTAITAALFLRRRQSPGLWLLWLCHLLILVPVLGLTEQPHFTSDRYSYVAMVPWSVGVAVLIARAGTRWLAIIPASAVVLILGALSLRQVAVWRDTESLGLHMVAKMGDHPRRFEIYRRMATALRTEGKVTESNAYYVKSLAGDPTAATQAIQQARKLEDLGQPREAFAQYLLASQLRPDLAEPRYRLGAILLGEDRAADALPFLREALRLEPGSAEIEITLGWALNRSNQAPEAIPHFEAALRLQPDDAAAHSGLGSALAAIGKASEALPHLERAAALFPNSAAAHFNLGMILLEGLGRNKDAAVQFQIVLKLQPGYPGAQEALQQSQGWSTNSGQVR